MFLWATSPAPDEYGGGSHVFNSPVFYEVSEDSDEGSSKRRDMKQLRGSKPQSDAFASARPNMFDAKISQTGPLGGAMVFDTNNNAIDDDLGQADDGSSVLMAQPLSSAAQPLPSQLIHYDIRVNDVYAYLRTAAYSGSKIAQFPTSEAEIRALGRDFADISVLAVELKTAWIDVRGLKAGEAKDYITIPAKIPVYKPDPDPFSSTKVWKRVPNTFVDTDLALVGMHVAFSAEGHAQMVWETFEHIRNTPNITYSYRTDQNNAAHEDRNDPWLFASKKATYAQHNEPAADEIRSEDEHNTDRQP
jgi:hypothetical protein